MCFDATATNVRTLASSVRHHIRLHTIQFAFVGLKRHNFNQVARNPYGLMIVMVSDVTLIVPEHIAIVILDGSQLGTDINAVLVPKLIAVSRA